MTKATKTRVDTFLDALFTNGAGEKADRLVLAKDEGAIPNVRNYTYRDLGGWCRGAIRDRLLDHFPELAALDEPTKGDGHDR